ncbi:MAG: FG-GAP repeat protein, partial [Thermoplasmata archaeon]|nr:FG-GAP repeat protein [Thermoplasmata archaeon]
MYLNNGGLELRELNEGMADLTIEGVDGSGFGSTLAAGDIDGDGYDDLIVGAISASENGEDSGRVYFFSGSETPAWNEVEDAAFYFDGEPGSNLGKHLLVTNLNNDGFMDFVIGDNEHSYVYYGTSDPASDYTGISEVHSYATVKGIHDDTQKLLSKVQHNDNERYLVNPKKKLHIHNFTIDEIKGEITEVTLRVQYITDQYYGYNQQERNWMKVRIGDGEWMDTIRPTDHHNSEHTETFDLFANGINTLEQLEKLEIFFESWEGKQGNDHYIHFDFIHLDIVSIPPGMNHTLEPGNLSSGDVNGDGFPELIISDPADQVIYFGGPKGLSAPDALQIKEYEGNATRTDTKKGNLTLAKIGQFKNGNFDDGWDHWSFVQNSRGEKDGDLRLLENDVGDWQVSPLSGAPTGGYGTNDNNLNGRGGDSSGLLKSDPFYIADEIEEITLWHRWEVRSFDTNEGMNIKLYRASDDTALLTIAEWMATSDSQNYGETGVLNASVVDLRGETVYLAMETLGGDGDRDEGLWQIDDIDLLPSLFYENGTFISNWIMFEGNLSSYTPSWNEELNNGTVSVKFRTNTSENWSDISECVSGEKIELPTPSDNLQYRVVMTNNGSATPVVRNLGIGYLFEGQIVPLYLSTSYGKVKLGDIDGDGADDLLFLKDEGIDIHYGSANFSEDFNASNITSYYSGNVADFSFLDLERDGKDEVVVVGESIRILDFSAEAVWQRNLTASRVVWNTASDPEYHLNTGAIYFLPAYDRELRVLDIDVPVLVNPGENQSIGITLGNAGMTDALNLTLYLNITAQGYSRNFSLGFNLSSMSSGVFAFIWPVPADEGVSYTLVAEAVMEDDRVPENDNLSMMVTTKRHGIRMSAPSPTASAHGGDELSYPIILNNTGTFETENVSLSLDLSLGWSGTYYYLGLPVEKILVAVSEQLTFIAFSPFDEMDDDFILNLTANAFSATTGVDLTATVLRPELVVEEVSLYRADGVQTNDTIHGVEGDVEELRIRVANQGPTYSTPFNVSIQRNDTPIQEFRHPGLDAGKDTWFSFRIVPEAGVLNITAEVDSLYEVPEMDEDNNLTEKFDIKNNTPVGDYNLTGEIRDIFGEGVENANVTLEWGNNDVILVTDENGDFSRVLTAMEYNDTMMLYINATDGN